MNTGENEQGLRKIIDLTRIISVTVFILHCYYYCYRAFDDWHLSSVITDRLLKNIIHSGLFQNFNKSKVISLVFLIISLIGATGKKQEKLPYKTGLIYILIGLTFFFLSYYLLNTHLIVSVKTVVYIVVTGAGYLMILSGGNLISRVIKRKLSNKDVFNKENETFPQEERLLENQYSINLPAKYNLKGKVRNNWINIINPFRALLVMGSPGSGKSYFIIRHVITQHIRKGFTMFIYDFKFDDLSLIAYNHFLKCRSYYKIVPQFYTINFDDLSRSHRCNPLDKTSMKDITDAAESARTILMGLNREWIKKPGGFFC